MHWPAWLRQVSLGPLQAHAEAALSSATDAQISPSLPALLQKLAAPPSAAPADYAAIVAGEL